MGVSGLKDQVRRAYSNAASEPCAPQVFPIGRAFAESLGYPAELLDRIPARSVEAFTGVSNVSVFANLPAGANVLDVGCGAGLDAFIAADRVKPGCVTGLDFSPEMIARADQSLQETDQTNVRFLLGDAEQIPLPAGSVDVALANGIFNLNPARERIFRELARVIRPGGEVYAAELLLRAPLPDEVRDNPSNWFA